MCCLQLFKRPLEFDIWQMYKEYIAPAPAVRVYDEKLRILTQVPAYNRKIQNISFSNITTPEMQNKKQP